MPTRTITIIVSITAIAIAVAIATTAPTSAATSTTTSTTTPTHPYNDTQELQTVINMIQQERTPENIAFFHKTNVDVTKPFVDIVAPDTTPSDTTPSNTTPSPQTKRLFLRILLYVIANNPLLHATSLFFKFYYNRTRPYKRFPQQITPLSTSTSEHTPSYPSSHSLQAFAIQKHLTKLYPEHAAGISATANRIADSRVIGGVHYPSDKEFARHLATNLPWT
jgi:acid phosphatase (class A)